MSGLKRLLGQCNKAAKDTGLTLEESRKITAEARNAGEVERWGACKHGRWFADCRECDKENIKSSRAAVARLIKENARLRGAAHHALGHLHLGMVKEAIEVLKEAGGEERG